MATYKKVLFSGDTGSFLPLSGGTLTGNLSLATTKSLNSSVDTGYISVYGGTSGNGANIFLSGNSRTTYGGNLDLASGTASTGNINFYTGSSATLRLKIGHDGDATFSGNVTANSGSKITSASADTTFTVETTSGTTIFPVIDLVSSHSSVGGKIRQGGSDAISFDKSQNATFGSADTRGGITITAPNIPSLYLTDTHSNTSRRQYVITSNFVEWGDFGIKQSSSATGDAHSGTTRFYISNAGDTTFSGVQLNHICSTDAQMLVRSTSASHNASITIDSAGTRDAVFGLHSANTYKWLLYNKANDSHKFKIQAGDGSTPFILEQSGDATFSGSVTANTLKVTGTGSDTGSSLSLWEDSNGSTYLAGYTFAIKTGSNNGRTTALAIGTNEVESYKPVTIYNGVSNGSNYDVMNFDALTGNYGGLWISADWGNGTQGRIGFYGTGTASANRGVALIGDSGTTPHLLVTGAGHTSFAGSQVIYADGNMSIPATKGLYFDGGSNTYIKESAGDVLSFYTNGSERLTIGDSASTFSGRVDGTVSGFYLKEGSSNAFSMKSNGANGYLLFRDEYNSADRLKIEQSGHITISQSLSTGSSATFDGRVRIGSSGGADVQLHVQETTANTDLIAKLVATRDVYLQFWADGTIDYALTNGVQGARDFSIYNYPNNRHDLTFASDSGDATFTGNVSLSDSKYIFLGTDSDLQLTHLGTHGNIINHTGNLYLKQNSLGSSQIFMTRFGGGALSGVFEVTDAGVMVSQGTSYLHGAGKISLANKTANSNWTGFDIQHNSSNGLDIIKKSYSGSGDVTAININTAGAVTFATSPTFTDIQSKYSSQYPTTATLSTADTVGTLNLAHGNGASSELKFQINGATNTSLIPNVIYHHATNTTTAYNHVYKMSDGTLMGQIEFHPTGTSQIVTRVNQPLAFGVNNSHKMTIGTNGNTTFSGDVITGKQLDIKGALTEDSTLRLLTDNAGIGADYWRIRHANSDHKIYFEDYSSGSYVSKFSIGQDGNATFSGTIGLENNKYLTGKQTNGTVNNLIGVKSDGWIVVGHSGYGVVFGNGGGSIDGAGKFYISNEAQFSEKIKLHADNGSGLNEFISIRPSGTSSVYSGIGLRDGNGELTLFSDRDNASDGAIVFEEGGTERARINSTGLGIGTASQSSYEVSANNLVIYEAGNAGLTIAGGTSNVGSIHFADGTSGADAYRGYINYSHDLNSLRFGTNGSERMIINSTGDTSFSGNITVGSGQSSSIAYFVNSGTDMYIEGNASALTIGSVGDTQYCKFLAGGKAHLQDSGAGNSITAHGDADNLVIEAGSGNTGITILNPSTNHGAIFFGDEDDNDAGKIDYDHDSNTMKFGVNGASLANASLSLTSTSATFSKAVNIAGDVTLNSTNSLLIPSGASVASLPFAFKDDTNTGMWNPSNNAIGFVTDGTERVNISDTGTVTLSSDLLANGGLNTGTDMNNRAIISYDSGALTLGTRVSSTNYFDTLRVKSAKVGIGRTPVNYPLEVEGHAELKNNGRVFLETGGAIADNGSNSWLMIPKDGSSLQSFYTAGTLAMSIDSSQNVTFSSSIRTTGNLELYTDGVRGILMYDSGGVAITCFDNNLRPVTANTGEVGTSADSFAKAHINEVNTSTINVAGDVTMTAPSSGGSKFEIQTNDGEESQLIFADNTGGDYWIFNHDRDSAGTSDDNFSISSKNTSNILQLLQNGKAYFSGNVYSNAVLLTSDKKFKDDIKDIPNALETTSKLRGVSYIDNRDKTSKLGVIAQEVEPIIPEVVSTESHTKYVDYVQLVPMLIESIKELKTEIETLKAKIGD